MTDKLDAQEIAKIAQKTGSLKEIIREKTAREVEIDLNQSDEKLIAEIEKNHLDDSLRKKGRLQFEGGASQALLDDLQASLPLLGDTLKEHFQNPASAVTGPGTGGVKAGAETHEKKMGFLHVWVVAGMVVMPVKSAMTKGKSDKPA